MKNNNFIKQFTLTNLEPLLNRALQLDPNMEALLKPLERKSLGFNVTSPAFGFTLAFTNNSVQVFSDYDPTADATITTSGLTLIKLFFNSHLPSKDLDLKLSGQASLLQSFVYLCKNADLQWESALSPYIGDTVAQTLGLISRQSWKMANQTLDKLLFNGKDYLKYDAPWVVTSDELDTFFQQIDNQRTNTERLEMRLAKLQKKITEHSSLS